MSDIPVVRKKKRGNPNIREISRGTQWKKGVKHARSRKGVPNKPIPLTKGLLAMGIATHPDTGEYMTVDEFRKELSKKVWKGDTKFVVEIVHQLIGKATEYIQQDINRVLIVTDAEKEKISDTITVKAIDTVPTNVETQTPKAPASPESVGVDSTPTDNLGNRVSSSTDILQHKDTNITHNIISTSTNISPTEQKEEKR